MYLDDLAGPRFPKRAEVHGTRVKAGSSRFSRPFAVVTGVLAAAVVTQGSGLAVAAPSSPNDSVTPKSAGTIASNEGSWAGLSSGSLADTGEFAESAGAASRAKLRTPILADSCLQMDTAADGARTTIKQKRVYYPILEGQFSTSSYYGYRVHPVTGAYKLHEGDDYQAPEGTPIYAVADGVVTEAGWSAGVGYKTVIQHTDTDGSMVESWYLHQQSGSQIVRVGQQVEAGERIGAVGSTGLSTGPHLHLEIHPQGGDSVAPSAWLQAHEAVFLGAECE